jgi:hypothetical protein
MTLAFAALVLLSSQLVLQPRGYAIHESCSEYNAQTPDAVKEAMEDVYWLVSAGKDHIGEDWSTDHNTKRLLFHREDEGEEENQEDKTLPTQADIDELKGSQARPFPSVTPGVIPGLPRVVETCRRQGPLCPRCLARHKYGTATNTFLWP